MLLPIALSLLTLFHSTRHNARCHAAIAPLADPKREGYSRLIRDIRSHPIATERIPPVVTDPREYGASTGGTRADDEAIMNVELIVMPVNILQLDPTSQVLEMTGYMSLVWFDPGLAWNESEYGGVSIVDIDSADLWTPALTMMNGVEESDILVDGKISVALFSNGMIVFAFFINLKTSCELDLTFFPFDEQTCYIIISSLSKNHVNINQGYLGAANLFKDFATGGEWTMTDIKLQNAMGFSDQLFVNVTKLTLTLQRKTTFYLLSTVGPMGMFTIMNCLVFLIPPESGEKTSFLIALFISNTIFASFINGEMPRTLDKQIPLIMIYLMFMWVWSIVIFLATILVLHKFHKEQLSNDDRTESVAACGNKKPTSPGFLEKMLSSSLAWMRSAVRQENRVSQDKARRNNQLSPGPQVISVNENHMTLSDVHCSDFTANTDPASTPNRSEVDDRAAISKPDSAVKAKTLDRIFLVLSLITVVSFDAVILIVSSSA